MRPYALPFLIVLAVPALVGCPSSPFMTGSQRGMAMPVDPTLMKPMPSPAPLGYPYPGMGVPSAPLIADGPSMDDAYHYVQNYVTRHYPGAQLASVRSAQVGMPGRIAKTGAWSFTYRALVSQPASSSTTQAVDIPTVFEGRQLTFKLSGSNELFAPEVTETAELQAIDYARVIPLSQALEICQGLGLTIGPAGVSAALLSDPQRGACYEIDYSVTYQWSTPAPGPYGYDRGYPAVLPNSSPAFSRGTYRLDAITGALLAHLTAP